MTTSRSSQICLKTTQWYHCTTRCVRRAFICGRDKLTQRDYTHRRQWIENRIMFLSNAFCIDVAGYAVMSNHYHVVLKIDDKLSASLTDSQVIARWLQLYPNNQIAKLYEFQECLDKEQSKTLYCSIKKWRFELSNLSRFMGLINQYIARRSNLEDDCKGRFWEARFNSQAILDDDALIRTLAYVDLNPVRAGVAQTAESSEHTSLIKRLSPPNNGNSKQNYSALLPFRQDDHNAKTKEKALPITFGEYRALIEWSCKKMNNTKYVHPDENMPSILDRLEYTPEQWIRTLQPKQRWHQRAIGSVSNIKKYCQNLNRRWIWQAEDHFVH